MSSNKDSKESKDEHEFGKVPEKTPEQIREEDELHERFFEETRSSNAVHPLDDTTLHQANILRLIRLEAGITSHLEFGKKVNIDPIRIMMTEAAFEPTKYKALSRAEYLHIAEACGVNIDTWLHFLPEK